MSDPLDQASENATAAPRATRWAWGICWLMFVCTVLNYMDRQAVALVSDRIIDEFGLRFEQFGWILAAFYLPYALFQVPAGYLADRWNVRSTYAGAVLLWSVAAIAIAFAPTLGVLMLFRAILGLGESFNWPCALRVTGMILPRADRGLGNGIFNSGAAVGAVLTPLVIVPLTKFFGWRVAFAVVGSLGFLWVIVWWLALGGRHKDVFAGKDQRAEGVARTGLSGRGRLVFGGLVTTAALVALLGARSVVPTEVSGNALAVRVEKTPDGGTPKQAPAVEGLLTRWLVKPGDAVLKNDPVLEIQREDVTRVIVAQEAGTVARLLAQKGDPVGGTLPALVLNTRLGLTAVWWGIALFMVGLLLAARLLPLADLEGSDWASSLGTIVRLRRFWVLVLVSVSINVCWHFLVGWLPTYLKTDRGMSFVTGGLLSALPFLAADVGNLGGGFLSQRLARTLGLDPGKARALVMSGCLLLIACGVLVGFVADNTVTLVLLGLMALGTAAFMANYFAFCQDVSPRHTGLVVGVLGGLGNLFAAGFAPVAGRIKDTTGSFGPVFVIVGLLPMVGVAALWLGWGRWRTPAMEEL